MDRIESEADEFFESVREAYLGRAQAEPDRIRVVDARQPAGTVATRAVALLRAYREALR